MTLLKRMFTTSFILKSKENIADINQNKSVIICITRVIRVLKGYVNFNRLTSS